MREGERRMRLFRCGYCNAEPGEPCVTKTGAHRSNSHESRWAAATLVGQLPVREAAK